MLLRAANRLPGRLHRHYLSDAVVSVDETHGTCIDQLFDLRRWPHYLVAQAIEIPAQSQHPVRLVSPQIGLHQRIGDQPRIGLRHAGALVHGGGEFDQPIGVDAR